MNYKYYVAGKIFDKSDKFTGEAEIITAEEADKRGYINGFEECRENHTLFVDGFDTMKEAEKAAKDYDELIFP